MEQKTIPAEKLRAYIWEGIRKEVYPDRVELYLPFVFEGGSGEPLCLTWKADGTLTDGGRTLTELKKRLGDITAYMDDVRKILAKCGHFRLAGGQKLVLEDHQSPLRALNQMLRAISLVSIVDSVTVVDD